jgi:hypothetical protein
MVHDRDNREVVMALREISRGFVTARDPNQDVPAEGPEVVVDTKSS